MTSWKIYTKAGDKGFTSDLSGQRITKDASRMECLGAIDELTSTIGLLRVELAPEHEWELNLKRIQTELMQLMAHVACPSDARERNQFTFAETCELWLEQWIDAIDHKLSAPSQHFVLPGGTRNCALCHVIRTQARKAERRLITLHHEDPLGASIIKYLNRLSDLFFTLARYELELNEIDEERWRPFKS